MRACFLGQNVCALGFGVATVQTPALDPSAPAKEPQLAKPPVQTSPPVNRMFADLKKRISFS